VAVEDHHQRQKPSLFGLVHKGGGHYDNEKTATMEIQNPSLYTHRCNVVQSMLEVVLEVLEGVRCVLRAVKDVRRVLKVLKVMEVVLKALEVVLYMLEVVNGVWPVPWVLCTLLCVLLLYSAGRGGQALFDGVAGGYALCTTLHA
jgi:hypothetical protein